MRMAGPRSIGRIIHVPKIEANIEIEDSLFEPPPSSIQSPYLQACTRTGAKD